MNTKATPDDMDKFEADLKASPLMTYWAKSQLAAMRRSGDGSSYINPEVNLIWTGYKIAQGLT